MDNMRLLSIEEYDTSWPDDDQTLF